VKEDWQRLRLSEVAEVFDGPHATPKTVDSGPIFLGIGALQDGVINLGETRHVTAEDFVQWTRRVKPQPNDVVFSYETRLGQAAIIPQGLECCLGRRMGLVRFRSGAIDPRFFLYQYLSPQFQDFLASKTIRGATVDRISIKDFPSFSIEVPSLPEQRRIVAILDEAFEGIATAKANAEKNLRNARELFGRIIGAVLEQLTPVSRMASLEDVVESDCSLSYGIVQPGEEFANGLPIVRPVDLNCSVVGLDSLKRIDPALAKSYDRTTLKGNDILLCVRGTTGTLALADCALAGANVTRGIVPIRFDSARLSQDFGYCLMRSESVQRQIRAKTYGTALMQINIRDLRQLTLNIPPLPEQEAIVRRLGDVEVATDQLIATYASKLAALDELKKSLLHRAFTGQLTSVEQTRTAVQPALQTTTPEFAANVIAFAHALHEQQRREKTLGHVKVQKLLHLVEAIGKIDLGRQPMKDAAGPNDFPHMLKVEAWAKAHDYFEMVKCGEGYEFRKLGAFDERLSSARPALTPYLQRVESVIDLLLPMDTKEAEVFATAHAAWNNLLIDGAEVTDNAIVSAAREGWHADKLKIPEHKFRSAIELIRQKDLVPDGSAKYVGGQQPLPL